MKTKNNSVEHLLLAEEISDLDGLAVVANASVDRKMSVHESHFVSVSLGDAGDQILNVAEGGADGGGGFTRTKPRINLELPFTAIVGNKLEVQVQMVEVSHEFSTRALNLDNLSVNLDAHAVGNIHGLRRQDRLHFASLFYTPRTSATVPPPKCRRNTKP